ncbi:CshA/CshB family fibrillar adhesin-related protein [Microbulbifer pacificus]|uniref:CshA/CshB family fibrillar adhesin-related protein n=1 Tax=Microbulbifer pacificus TaxID=407164 RepID=UPI000CF3FA1E|nr:CshA/CshB family fibrillar adhesin-related protein [Microbulbifer pacificus]
MLVRIGRFSLVWCGFVLWAACLLASPAAADNCYHATAQGSTGPGDWQTYCWLDLTSYNDTAARSGAGQNFSYTLPDGTTMAFNMKVSGGALTSATAPSWSGAAVGNTAFLGIAGRPILYQSSHGTTVTVTISGIQLTPPVAGTITNYMFVAGDGESSNGGESLRFETNGGNWELLDQVGPTSGSTYPSISGVGTDDVQITGASGTVGAYIVGSSAPTTVTTTLVGSGLQGAMFAVRFASIRLNTEIIGARVDAADQFRFTINATNSGAVLAEGTSSGSGQGPFTAATLSSTAAIPLTLNQTMASGSSSAISRYRSVLTCTNETSSSTPLPNNVETTSYNFGVLQFGDAVRCTFTEAEAPIADLSTSTKSVLDVNGGDANPGDVLRYTITINESAGEPVSGVSVTDNISSLLENLSVVSLPAGATYNYNAGTGQLDVSGIDLSASGSAQIVFEANIVAGASHGDLISNTAVVTNPDDASTVNVTAPTVTVTSPFPPSTGIKKLYPYFASAPVSDRNTLQRIVPVVDSSTTLGEGGATTLTMTPQTQAPLKLTAGSIQIPLCMRRSTFLDGSGRSRTVRVQLNYAGASSGSIGSQTRSVELNYLSWLPITFNIDLPSDLTLNPGTAIRMTVTNNSSGDGQRDVYLSSTSCGAGDSYMAFDTSTVINIDSLGVYSSPFSATTTQPSYSAGSEAFIRAVVSDPFGSFDITGAAIEIADANGATVQSLTAMNEVDDSGVATKTYEFPYTIPASPASGTWTVRVIAYEGTEGTVTHSREATFMVGGSPLLSVMKIGSTLSDPINGTVNPKAIPRAVIQYTLRLSNSGDGMPDENSLVLSDALPEQVELYVGDLGGTGSGPITFTDGAPASGLSWQFIALNSSSDHVEFSTDGIDWSYVPVPDSDGFDAAVRHIRLKPAGRMNGQSGGSETWAEFSFRVRVR